MRIDRPPWVHIPQRFLSWPSFPRQLKNHSRITKTKNQSHGSIYIQNLEPTPKKRFRDDSKKKLMDFSDSSLYSHVLIGVITSDLLQKTKHVRIFTQSQSPKRPGPLPLGLLQRQNHEGHCQHSSLPQRVLGKGYPFVRFGNIRAVELDIQSLSLLLMVQQSHPLRWPVLPLFLEGFIHPRWFVPHFVQHCQYQLPSSTPNDPSNYPLVHQHINGESSCFSKIQ